MATDEQVATLRPMIGELTEASYTDEVLKVIIEQAENDLDLAAAVVWEQKASSYSTLVDVSESGSSRSMSQIYKNALAQAKYYGDKVTEEVVEPTTVRARTRTAVRK